LLNRFASALYDPLRPLLAALASDRFPTHAEMTALAEGVTTSRGMALRFVPPREHDERERRYYELRIAQTGEVETRPGNWHDLFNALVWIAYPRAKAAINAQHAAILEEGGEAEAKRRSPARDALTLFDEGGIAVLSASNELTQLIVDFEWKALFWTRRAELERRMRFLAFGHALFEQAMAPYLGMVAKTIFLPVDESILALPLQDQVREADRLLAAHFADRSLFRSPKLMAPMPVLGVPGWHPDTSRESYYDDPVHFRKKKPKPETGEHRPAR
jgi:hypothetical protein